MGELRAVYISLCTWIMNMYTRRPVSSWVDKPSDPSQTRADYSHLPKQNSNILKGLYWRDGKRNLKGPSMQIWQCPIYNGTLEIFIWWKMRKISSFLKMFISDKQEQYKFPWSRKSTNKENKHGYLICFVLIIYCYIQIADFILDIQNIVI